MNQQGLYLFDARGPQAKAIGVQPYYAPTLKEHITAPRQAPITHTLSPTLTSGAVLAVKFKDGVMAIGDTLGAWGNMARFMDVKRMRKVGDSTVVAAAGDISDFQEVTTSLDDLVNEDTLMDDGGKKTPREIYNYLGRVFYNRRNKFDPYWTNAVVLGYHKGEPFLGCVDMVGTSFEDPVVATGMGMYFGITVLRKGWKPDMSEQEARQLLENSMRVQLYRDKGVINKFQIATATQAGVSISDTFSLDTNWDIANSCRHFPDL